MQGDSFSNEVTVVLSNTHLHTDNAAPATAVLAFVYHLTATA